MKHRWTIKELRDATDEWVIRGLLSERMSELNPNAPLYNRLNTLYDKYDRIIRNQVNPEGK